MTTGHKGKLIISVPLFALFPYSATLCAPLDKAKKPAVGLKNIWKICVSEKAFRSWRVALEGVSGEFAKNLQGLSVWTLVTESLNR